MNSLRLLKIAEMVEKNSIVADVGTDHGYIPVYLMENNISKKVIGSDISPGSLEKIKSYVQMKSLEEFIDMRLGDGLDVIKPYEIDTLIMAGMGAVLMMEILEENKEVTNSIVDFILQPMVGPDKLREYLYNNGFKIVDEELVFEKGKYYEIIHARKGIDKVENEWNYEISQNLIDEKHPVLKDYLNYKIKFSKNIIDNLKNEETENAQNKKSELKSKINLYEEVLKEIEI